MPKPDQPRTQASLAHALTRAPKSTGRKHKRAAKVPAGHPAKRVRNPAQS